MKADADALPKPTGVAWAPLVALMPVPGAASLEAFEAKLAETCAGPNVKDDAPRDAAKARRRARSDGTGANGIIDARLRPRLRLRPHPRLQHLHGAAPSPRPPSRPARPKGAR